MDNQLILYLPLLGKINIYINDIELFKFSERQLNKYILEKKSIPKNTSIVKITSDLNNFSFDNITLSKKFNFKNNSIKIEKNHKTEKLKYHYTFKNNLEISILREKNFIYFLKYCLFRKYSINHNQFYNFILYPIFSLYSLLDNYYIIHGSLLKIKNKYIVINGLDGVGKSSISLNFEEKGYKLLADNFVLFNGDKFFGLNLPMRIDSKSQITKQSIIYSDSLLKEIQYKNYLNFASKVSHIFFIAIGEKLKIKKTNLSTIIGQWTNINNCAPEVLDANLFCAPFFTKILFNTHKIPRNKINFYLISIPFGNINEGVRKILCQLNI